jgi:hypothetical protein
MVAPFGRKLSAISFQQSAIVGVTGHQSLRYDSRVVGQVRHVWLSSQYAADQFLADG